MVGRTHHPRRKGCAMTQLDLLPGKAPLVSDDDVIWLMRLLKNSGSWKTAAEICWMAGYKPTENFKRKLRAIASESKGSIISGQSGYLRNDEASLEERKHAAAWLRHQARELFRRADEIESYNQVSWFVTFKP